MVLSIIVHETHLQSLLEHRMLGPILEVLIQWVWGMRLRICMSDNFPGEADATQVWDTHYEKYFTCPLTKNSLSNPPYFFEISLTHTNTHLHRQIYTYIWNAYHIVFPMPKELILKELIHIVFYVAAKKPMP